MKYDPSFFDTPVNRLGTNCEKWDALRRREGADLLPMWVADMDFRCADEIVQALTERAAKLPRFELAKPESVIGRNTVSNMQAGIVYGYIGQINYLVERMKKELGAPDTKVIATGGLAVLVAGESNVIDVMDGLLTLKGLCLIHQKNVN